MYGCGVGHGEASGHVVREIFGDERLADAKPFGVLDVVGVEAIRKTVDGSADRLHLGVGGHEQHFRGQGLGQSAGLVHRAVVGQVERGALAREWLGGLEVEQVGVGVGGQAIVVLAQVVVVTGGGHDEEPSHGVLCGAHLLEQRLEVGQPLCARRGREVHGAQAVLLGGLLHTLVDEVVVVAVAHGIGVVDDGDERLGRRCIGGVGLIDDVTLLGAGGERQHGREYQDYFLHCTDM